VLIIKGALVKCHQQFIHQHRKRFMAYKDSELNKGQLRKLNAYRKSVNDNEKAAQAMFKIFMDAQPVKATASVDKVSVKLVEALSSLANDKSVKLGRYGYTVRRAKGKGASGFVAVKNDG
jgi:hypothetical protein